MSTSDVIRAWKDEAYRLSLSEEERALLPENPAGEMELTDEALDNLPDEYNVPSCVAASC